MYARAPVGKTAKTSCPRNTPDTTSSCFGFKAAYPKSCAALFAAISTSRLSSLSRRFANTEGVVKNNGVKYLRKYYVLQSDWLCNYCCRVQVADASVA